MCDSDHEDRLIIPPAQAREVVRRGGKVYVRECPCRVLAQNCPRDTWEVCLLFEDASQGYLQNARSISTDEALSILQTIAARRAICNLFYTHTNRAVTEICSCCTCCCRPLRRIKDEKNYGKLLRSEYVVVTDPDLCTGCGLCEESCFFEARHVEEGALRLMDERCFGCGRCIASCPEQAITLERIVGRGESIP
jgi:Na+-translocating ferredoxin:NAD+ oxidoreductase subunit B